MLVIWQQTNIRNWNNKKHSLKKERTRAKVQKYVRMHVNYVQLQ